MIQTKRRRMSGWSVVGLGLLFAVAAGASPLWAYPSSVRKSPPKWVDVQPVTVKSFGQGSSHSGGGKAPLHQSGSPMRLTPPQQKFKHPSIQGRQVTMRRPSSGKPKGGQPSMAEQQRLLAMKMNRQQTLSYQKLIGLIVSPCCWTQPVSLHASSMSDMVKVDVQRRLLAGHTEKQIIAAYKKRFGERILSIPEKSYIFMIPIAASLLALFLVGFVILRWTHRDGEELPSLELSSMESEEAVVDGSVTTSKPDDSDSNAEVEPESKSGEPQK